jgi:hypothetical protein
MIVAGSVWRARPSWCPASPGPFSAPVLIQMYLLLDCVDGEIARWRKQTSITGVYLDRVGHYLSEPALLVGFGLRAADLWDGRGATGCGRSSAHLAALGAILIKAETDLVDVARPADRPGTGPGGRGRDAVLRGRPGPQGRRRLQVPPADRRHRGDLLILVVAIVDAGPRRPVLLRLGVAVLAGIALLQTVLHLVSILASSRLR